MSETIARILRRLPDFRGKSQLAGILLGKQTFQQTDVLVSGSSGLRYFLPNLVENIGSEIFLNGIYERETSDFIIKKLPAGGVFLDLGANIGAIAIPVAKRRSDVSVVAVEAAPWIFDYLIRNLALNDIRIRTFNRALYDTDGQTVRFYSPKDKFGKGSMSPAFTSASIEVATITVDSLMRQLSIPHIDLIKIDVEGFESKVFSGAGTHLRSPDGPDILFEFVDWAECHETFRPGAAQKALLEMGYNLFTFDAYGPMNPLPEVVTSGFHMLYATKKSIR